MNELVLTFNGDSVTLSGNSTILQLLGGIDALVTLAEEQTEIDRNELLDNFKDCAEITQLETTELH